LLIFLKPLHLLDPKLEFQFSLGVLYEEENDIARPTYGPSKTVVGEGTSGLESKKSNLGGSSKVVVVVVLMVLLSSDWVWQCLGFPGASSHLKGMEIVV
jgi:hypothetical protein